MPCSVLIGLTAMAAAWSMACDGRGPAVEANPQSITFLVVPVPEDDQESVVVVATASSGLAVRYSSLTPSVCSVDRSTGLVTGLRSGTCTVAADQSGNAHFAPAPQARQDVVFVLSRKYLTFAQVPTLDLFDLGTIVAVDSAGGTVAYASKTPLVCSVESDSGLVVALASGDCTVVASVDERQATRTFAIGPASTPTFPKAPAGITVVAGDTANTAIVRIGGTPAGGAPLVGYLVISEPVGFTENGSGSPIVVHCPASCAGIAFSVQATNALGTGPPSEPVHMITDYGVVAIFHEPDTQPNDSVFVGSFLFDATTGTVSELHGRLSESMTGGATPYPHDTMDWVSLDHQLSSVPVTIDGSRGLLVATFRLPSTATLSEASSLGGTDGWSPGTGMALYNGYPGPNPGNAYVRIFVNLSDPTAPPTQAQIDKLAYADCTPAGLMGATCMTGTTVAGYGTLGSMSGHPLSQVIAKQ